MSNTDEPITEVAESASAPVEAAPIEGTVLPASTPVPAPEPVEADEPDDVDEDEDDEHPEGIPAAHLAAGGLSSAAVTLGSLYQLLGLPGLVGGAVLTGGSAVAYVRHRYQRRQRSTWGVSWEDGKGRRGPGRRAGSSSSVFGGALRSEGRTSRSGGRSAGGLGGVLGGRAGRSTASTSRSGALGGLLGGRGTRPSGGTERPAGRGRSGSGGSVRERAATSSTRATRSATGTTATDKTKGKNAAGPNSPIQTVRHAATATGKATRAFGRRARTAGAGTARLSRAGAQQVKKAAAWADEKTGHRAGRAYQATTKAARRAARATGRAAASQARKAGAWADRKTGGRVSTAWKAARTTSEGERTRFGAARRRAAASLGGWPGAMAAPLIALLALVVERWRAHRLRKTEKAAKAAESSADATEKSAETPKAETTTTSAAATTAQACAEAAEETTSVVHGGEGEPPITATVTCPRCGSAHEVTVPGGEAKAVVTCGCGYSITFFRIPADRPTEPAPAAPTAHRHPYALTTNRTYARRNPMVNPLVSAAADLNSVAASHAPGDMWAVTREMDQLSEIPLNVAMALRTYTMRLQSGEYPISPVVGEAMHELYARMAQLAAVAEDITALYRRIHAPDLARAEAPRNNEHLWDVGRNG
ncbi:hypothetical protein [Planomonospora parontospora]|uniref:hypothetical protein n=1 Tax=Planomonospora parontospora TaxID=58119 RepID=UPI0016701511|nr:hypothetical protein [Planomonospora parontospora]GGL56595.1 hypothetical protein GCM10014719_67520 [Planomonospora parontospora subsp. antibiotica]GII19942.1 hypothetical protein Ppa05_66680 [Planomonospora parontospora subsp. antibiotica]